MTDRLLFNSVNPGSYRGQKSDSGCRIGVVGADGTGQRFIDFDRFGIDGQVNWQPGPLFGDGRRFVVLSMEAGICHLDSTRTNLWLYDLDADRLSPLMGKYRPVPYITAVSVVDGGERIVTAHNAGGANRHVVSDLDGSGAVEIPIPDDGFTYCLETSPDGRRVVFHTSSRRGGYRITVMGVDGSDPVEVAGDPEHLFFGPSWSPDGQWLLFTDCQHREDREHMRADLVLARPDGSDLRHLTRDRSHWLSPVYGGPETKGGGSEIPHWLPDGRRVTYVRLKPGSRTAWPLQEKPEVDDHFNRDFRPEEARGGTDLCLLDPFGGTVTALTDNPPLVWDFRATCSPDGGRIAFCRSRVGERSELWITDADGANPRFLSAGWGGAGVDHPKWLAGPGA